MNQQKIELLSSMKVFIEIEQEELAKVDWSHRDRQWFHNHDKNSGMLHVINIVLEDTPSVIVP